MTNRWSKNPGPPGNRARYVRGDRIPLLIVAAVFLSSCGLVRTISLFPPNEQDIVEEFEGQAKFEHNTDNAIYGDAFQGYELYYKIYGNSDAQRERIETEENAVLDPDFDARPRLRNRGFQRLRWEPGSEQRQRPLIDLVAERDTPVEVTVDFTGIDNGGPFVSWERADGEPERRELRRTIAPGDPDVFTTDAADYSPGEHDDVDSDAAEDGDGGFQIVVYVLAYGFDPDERVAVYSFEARRVLEGYVLTTN